MNLYASLYTVFLLNISYLVITASVIATLLVQILTLLVGENCFIAVFIRVGQLSLTASFY
jgi:hypothetical protein